MKKLLALIIILSTLVLCLSACAEERSALAICREFAAAYGVEGAIYSPTVREGEEGYVREGFFESLYGEPQDSVGDYALLLISDLDEIGEVGIFICESDYDALLVTEMQECRLENIRRVAASAGMSFPEGAFVMRKNKCVVLCAIADAERAERILRRVI